MSSVVTNHRPVQNPTESASNRACDSCRQHKVRCLLPDSPSSSKCQRCAKTDRECLFTAPQKRKQRKRTDTRVAELEREVKAMRALFNRKKDTLQKEPDGLNNRAASPIEANLNFSGQSPSADFFPLSSTESPRVQQDLHGGACSTLSFSNTAIQQASTPSMAQTLDVIDRGIISMDQAKELFDIYLNDIAPKYPVVTFPDFYPVENLRETRPTLFLAVLAAASGKVDPSLYSTLHSEAIVAYAHRTLMLNEKNIELVQAMLVIVIWYYPPGKFGQLKFYEYIHMAASMAMDIGIGSSPSRRAVNTEANILMTGEPLALQNLSTDAEVQDLEERRTFLACYTIATGIAMNMRRPSMMRFNKRVSDCIETLTKSPYASSSDKCIASWAKLISIGEEATSAFSFDDPAAIVSLSEPRVQLMLRSFERQLEVWQREFNSGCKNDSLMLMYHTVNMFLHELSLHGDHPPEDFRPPYRLDKIYGSNKANASQYIDAITVCISSAHASLDIFLSTDIETLRAFPVFNYVRMMYSAVVLLKLHVSASTSSSPISGAIDVQSLKLDFYLDNLIGIMMLAVGSVEFRSAFTFAGGLIRLRAWYKEYKSQTSPDTAPRPRNIFGPEDILIPNSTSTGGPNENLVPPNLALDVLRMPGELDITRDPGTGVLTEKYGTQMDSTNDSQLFYSNMGIDSNLMAIFDDMGQSFGGDLNDWDPSMVVPGDISSLQMSDMNDKNLSQQHHV